MGRLTGVFGVRGELKCRPNGGDALSLGAVYALGAEDGARELRCSALRRHHAKAVIAFDGIVTPEAARALVGRELYAERGNVELGPGEYLDADLIGLALVDEAGHALGRVVGVEHYPAQDCLVVGPRKQLVPLVKAFVRTIDPAAGTIVTSLPEGLLED